MPITLLKTICCALLGAGCGIVSLAWARLLMKQRKLEYNISKKNERIFTAVMVFLGAVVGALVPGIVCTACGLILLIIGGTVTLTDRAHRVIPNPTVLAILALKLAAGIPTLFGAKGFLPFNILKSLIGLAVCFAIFALPGLFGKQVGAGDIKLAAAMGFFLELTYSLLGIAIMGLVVIGYSIVQRRMPILAFIKSSIPMGPFIVFGLVASYVLSFIFVI